jgi:TPR repeat protein
MTARTVASLSGESAFPDSQCWLPEPPWARVKSENLVSGERYMCEHGMYAEAFEWYYRAAEKGYPAAQLNVGLIYRRGIGVEKNEQLARTWLAKAAASADTNIASRARTALDQK